MSFLPQGAGQGPAGVYNKLVVSPGQRLALGNAGGTLLLGPPGGAPGSMTFEQMTYKTWHLLREDGPYTGFPAPTTGDYSQTVVQADLNIALAQFVADTGIAPDLCDRMDTFSVFPTLDFPLPPGLVSLTRVEYTPSGQQTYVLLPKGFQEFDQLTGGLVPNDQGQPYYYRQPWAGYIRLTPQPTIGNAIGPGIGTYTVTGAPVAGNVITLTLTNPGSPPIVLVYTVQLYDTLSTIAYNLSTLINQSGAVTGSGSAFLQPASNVANTVSLTAILAPGTNITYQAAVTGTGVLVTPIASTALSPNGDTITFYYSSLGILLVYPNDVPGIPPQYHIALVYRVLADYWQRKSDPVQSQDYMKKYLAAVKMAKSFTFDTNRATQPTLGGDLDDWYSPTGVW